MSALISSLPCYEITEQFSTRNHGVDEKDCESSGGTQHSAGSCASVAEEHYAKQETRRQR